MDVEVEKKIKILSNIPDEILSSNKCKLINSTINFSIDGWLLSRTLNYSEYIDKARINIWIGSPIQDTYEVGITVFVLGRGYDYDRVPQDYNKAYYHHVDIAYKIAAYLKLMGLRLL